MPIVFEEALDSRSGSDDQQSRKYYLYGTNDEVFAQNVARINIPTVIATATGNLYRDPVFDYAWKGPYCLITAEFKRPEKVPPQTGSFRWDCDTTGATVTVKAGKSHVATFPAPGGDGKPFGTLIGATKDGVEGTEIVIPAMKFNVAFRHPEGVINLSKVFSLGDLAGSSNSDTFFTRPAGSFLFIGFTCSDGSDSEAEVNYQFAYSKNIVNEVVGGIAGVTKDGWDYAWIEFVDDVFNGTIPVKKPVRVHVDRVYDRIAFATTFGFG
jgi:hypothetical protein